MGGRPWSENTSAAKELIPTLVWVATIAFVVGAWVLMVARPDGVRLNDFWLEGTAGSPVFATIGWLVWRSQPTNRIGLVFAATGLVSGLQLLLGQYATNALEVGSSLPLGAEAGAIWPSLQRASVTGFAFLLLWFPTGRSLSPRWRPLVWLTTISLFVLVVATPFASTRLDEFGDVPNPLVLRAVNEQLLTATGIAGLGLLATFVLGVLSVVLRFRRSGGEERLQMKLFTYGALMAFFLIAVTSMIEPEEGSWLGTIAWTAGPLFLPVATGIAILKYRLYDIDVVINKTIVFGVLAAFITTIYVAIVVGIGTLLGSSDEPNLALSIAATAVVAIAFSPVKDKTQRFANRLVYGHRASPYEVMANLARTVATVGNPHEVVAAVAHAAATGVNASTRVTLHLDDARTQSATWPQDDESVSYGDSFAIAHRGQALGTLEVTKPRNEPLTPKDRELLTDLCAQAGLGLHNARLVLELQARLVEIEAQAHDLKASRERIVSAQDDSRRALEKDITSGPRKGLEAIYQKLDRALELMGTNAEEATLLLDQLGRDTTTTLDALREIARGIYPPLLADKGIVAALEAHIRKHDLPVELHVDDDLRDMRFEESVETTIYFCCVETLRNAPKAGSSVVITLSDSRDAVTFTTARATPASDSDPSAEAMADRLAALNGTLTVSPTDDRETTIRGMVPLSLQGALV